MIPQALEYHAFPLCRVCPLHRDQGVQGADNFGCSGELGRGELCRMPAVEVSDLPQVAAPEVEVLLFLWRPQQKVELLGKVPKLLPLLVAKDASGAGRELGRWLAGLGTVPAQVHVGVPGVPVDDGPSLGGKRLVPGDGLGPGVKGPRLQELLPVLSEDGWQEAQVSCHRRHKVRLHEVEQGVQVPLGEPPAQGLVLVRGLLQEGEHVSVVALHGRGGPAGYVPPQLGQAGDGESAPVGVAELVNDPAGLGRPDPRPLVEPQAAEPAGLPPHLPDI